MVENHHGPEIRLGYHVSLAHGHISEKVSVPLSIGRDVMAANEEIREILAPYATISSEAGRLLGLYRDQAARHRCVVL